MKRTSLNFIIDVIAFTGFVFLTTTGVLMHFVLPPGSGHYSTVWGLDRHEWGGLHLWIAIVFFSILAIHLVLHWRWIICVATSMPREGSGFRAGLGIIGVLSLIAISVTPLLSPVERNMTDSISTNILSSHKYEEFDIRGSMTLLEIEASTGVPGEYIIESLELPESVSKEEQLGFLKRKHGFEMNTVREAIKEYKSR
jgi:hypothetical protein